MALAAAAVLVALAGAEQLSRGWRLAGSLVATGALALAVAALAGGPAAWAAPLAFVGEYPGAVAQVGPIPAFLGEFPARVPTLPDFAAQHPPFATVFYVLVDRVWAGLDAAALATVAAGCLGLLVAAGLARDELGDQGERVAVVCWALAPVTVLYVATSADAMWAPVLAGPPWPPTGAAAPLLAVDAGRRGAALAGLDADLRGRPGPAVPGRARPGRPGRRRLGLVLRWAAATSAVVLGLAGLLLAATGYDVAAAVAAVDDFWSHAPGPGSGSGGCGSSAT